MRAADSRVPITRDASELERLARRKNEETAWKKFGGDNPTRRDATGGSTSRRGIFITTGRAHDTKETHAALNRRLT